MIIFVLIRHANWIAGIFLAVAFILTFWRRRSFFWFAAGFYCAGSLIYIGPKILLRLLSVWLELGFESGELHLAAFAGLPVPILESVYGTAAAILIWPWIPQKSALFLGKILHLIFLPILVLIIFAGVVFNPGQSQAWLDLQWLVYGPLWFRIRDRFAPGPPMGAEREQQSNVTVFS